MKDVAINIGNRLVGAGHPAYIIAEMSGNHAHDFERAVRIMEAAKNAGADAIKLQTYTPDTMTIDSAEPWFRISGTAWNGRSLFELYGEACTPWEWQPRLRDAAVQIGLGFLSTPFDSTAVDFLESLKVPAHKIASFEIVDLPLLRRVAQTGKPILLSTGMATLAEIDEAVTTIRAAGGEQLALLKCTSAYPALPDGLNLSTIPNLAEAFSLPVGLSDHSLELAVPVAAVVLGACIIEKHLTLSRADGGPDSDFSLEPDEFGEMVHAVRVAEKSLGGVHYGVSEREADSRVFRRSLFVVRDVRAGEPLTSDNVRVIRPGYGLHSRHLKEVLGRRVARDVARGTPLSWELVGGEAS